MMKSSCQQFYSLLTVIKVLVNYPSSVTIINCILAVKVGNKAANEQNCRNYN